MKKFNEFPPLILTKLNTPWEKAVPFGTEINFPRQSIIPTMPGDPDRDGMYYLISGRVRLSNITSDGSEKILFYIGEKTLFNEIPMFISATNAVFTAVEPTRACFWPRKSLSAEFIQKYPDLIINILNSLSSKASNFHIQLCSLGLFSSFTNICRSLYSMHLYQRKGDKLIPHLTQSELAALLGIHRSSLHKALTRLKEEKIIKSYSKKKLIITDVEKLLFYAKGNQRPSCL